MRTIPNISVVALLIAHPARAIMLNALLDHADHSAGELATRAGISPQTASMHLAKLVRGQLVDLEKRGKFRYFRLKNKEVAHALEALAILAPCPPIYKLRDSLEKEAFYRARTCYDHLAGRLGVSITQALIDRRYIRFHDEIYEVTRRGYDWLKSLGIECEKLHKNRRVFASRCLDWSERKYHLAGALGAALNQRFMDMQWLVRIGDTRAVRVTETGRLLLQKELNITWES